MSTGADGRDETDDPTDEGDTLRRERTMEAAKSQRPWYLSALLPVVLISGGAILCAGTLVGFPCFTTGIRYGLWMNDCPVGNLRAGANVTSYGLVRGGEGEVQVRAFARYLYGRGSEAYPIEGDLYRGFSTRFELLDSEDEPVEGVVARRPSRSGSWHTWKLALPEVPDDDYTLRVTLDMPFESTSVDLPLPLFAPAAVHVASDRPLYKPGQDVLLRSVMLRRTDLSPIDGRPGRWRIRNPSGEEMLVEKDRAGAFGISDSSFPLDVEAPHGTWKAVFESGGDRDEIAFDVKPFKLPRFTVELDPAERWFGPNDPLIVEGTAKYTSGAPVASAPVRVRVSKSEGRWTPPLEWDEAVEVRTDAQGRFTVDMGRVPTDLVELAKLRMSARVTEEAGEVASGSASLVLAADDLMIESVTELGEGLVGGFNNRAYLRVMTPDGKPLGNADVTISDPWDPTRDQREAKADADGVVAIQLDPGDPVTVRIPAVPSRYRALEPDVPRISGGSEVTTGRALNMDERRSLDRLVAPMAACGDFVGGGQSVSMGVRVAPSGAVSTVMAGTSEAERCVDRVVRGLRMPSGPERIYNLQWYVPDSQRPSFNVSTRDAWGSSASVRSAMTDALRSARRCLPLEHGRSGGTVMGVHWSVREDSAAIDWRRTGVTHTAGLSSAEQACISRALGSATLGDEATGDAMGSANITLSVPRGTSIGGAGASTKTGYELKVMAKTDGAEIGETRAVFDVGRVPPLRIRATPSLAMPGDEVEIEFLRGPDYYGELPREFRVYEGSREVAKLELPEGDRKVRFKLPTDVDGFLHADHDGARMIVFVQPKDRLTVGMSTDKDAYRPGETAKLTVSTRVGENPTTAAVGLSGVDSTLGQLATLLGPDDFGRVTVRAESDEPAFGSFDPRALALGQIRGENAAKAAVMRISNLPTDYAGDVSQSPSGQTSDDDIEVLTVSFYRALNALHERVRAWEVDAPEGEVMTPQTMVELWNGALADTAKADKPALDAYGRKLTLDLLPWDLAEQVDPRNVVREGTRLPEDVIDWHRYIDTEVRR